MAIFFDLTKIKNPTRKEYEYLSRENMYIVDDTTFKELEGTPYNAFWLGEKFIEAFDREKLEKYAQCCTGMQTGGNPKYVRLWYEVNFIDTTIYDVQGKFEKYNCGGENRRWYGNHYNVVNWENNGAKIRAEKNSVIRNEKWYRKEGISWKRIAGDVSYIRYLPEGFIIDQAGDSLFPFDIHNLHYLLGFLNSKVATIAISFVAPTMNLTAGNMKKMPVIFDETRRELIEKLVKENVNICRNDWDDYEVSWDFGRHPLLKIEMGESIKIKNVFLEYEQDCFKRFDTVQKNEVEINQNFIAIYGMEGDLGASVEEDSVNVRKANLEREIKSLITYAVGCIMGRYSLKEDGLINAGGEWDESRYSDDFKPCEYGVMPITEEQFFEEDLCTRVIDFIKVVYGEDTLNENLKFIANALKPDSFDAPKKIIRDYLFNDFFYNHYQIYQHRPIYWQLDSGKEGGFRAIVYMHRFTENTLPLVRAEYIQDLRYKYEEEIQRKQKTPLEGKTTAEKNAVKKDIAALDKKIVECSAYDDLLNHVTSSIQNYVFDLDDGVKTNYAKFLSIDGDKNKNILTVIKL
jgi:hypothetical protein